MMGVSSYKTRAELVRECASGVTPDVDAGTQRRFDDGHRFEELARPKAEQIIGDELYPVVGADGKYSASFDGLTLMNDVAFEHKSLNDSLRAAIRQQGGNANDFLAPMYRVQMEQQCMVSGAQRVLFMASKWDGDSLIEERHCWYTPDLELRKQIVAGWAQFEVDVAAYVQPERADVVVAAPVHALPSVSVVVTGEISIRDNFKAFEVALRDFLEHRLIRKPKTDQDFVDLDVQIKAMKGAEAALDSAETQMLAQIQTVDEAKRTKDMLAELVRSNRLMAEKLLASEKERRRGEIVAVGVTGLRDHIAALNARLGKPYMPTIAADFGLAIKGKKSLASMEDAVSTELARAKIDASSMADRIDANMRHLRECAADVTFLFADTQTIVLKAPDDLQALVASRIGAHKEAEAKRLAAERERIRAEESARLQREQEAREATAKRDREAAEAQAAAVARAAATQPPAPAPAPKPAMAGSPAAADPSRACAVDRVVSPPAPADARPPITTGTLCARLGDGITVTTAYLQGLGFTPAERTARSGTYWHEADFPRICLAIANRLQEVAEGVTK